MTMTMHTPRTLFTAGEAITECNDGTICENFSPCVPHPVKEGSYMCDCLAARDSNNNKLIQFAGPYCEHQATSYCEAGSELSAHAFCVNGGECKREVGRTEEHAGCKCRRGYEGDYCQFVAGSRPSDWGLNHYVHPSLVSVYGSGQDDKHPLIFVMMVVAIVSFVSLLLFSFGYVLLPSLKNKYLPGLRDKLNRKEKEMDTAEGDSLGGRRSSVGSPVASAGNLPFVGGKSVYKKKTHTTGFVTSDTMEADGAVLKDALVDLGIGEEPAQKSFEEIEADKGTSMEDVNLNDESSAGLVAIV